MPLLRDIVGASARIFLDPCCRVLFWQQRAIRKRLKGKPARWASWRFRVNRDKCASLVGEDFRTGADGECTAAQAADIVVAALIRKGDDVVAALVSAKPHRLREVADLLGPETRRALELPSTH